MQQFRIQRVYALPEENLQETIEIDIKPVKKYKLLKLLDQALMNGKEVWDTISGTFESPLDAEIYAHEMSMADGNDIVKEFTV